MFGNLGGVVKYVLMVVLVAFFSLTFAFTLDAKVVNNTPWILRLNNTGIVYGAHYVHGKEPPEMVADKAGFAIESHGAFSFANMSYVVANTLISAPSNNGCEIVYINVNAYHQVCMKVRSVYNDPNNKQQQVHCTCQVTEGLTPTATLMLNRYSSSSDEESVCRSGEVACPS